MYSRNEISKFYCLIRGKIKKKMHNNWNKKLMYSNISDKGYLIFEMDDS